MNNIVRGRKAIVVAECVFYQCDGVVLSVHSKYYVIKLRGEKRSRLFHSDSIKIIRCENCPEYLKHNHASTSI